MHDEDDRFADEVADAAAVPPTEAEERAAQRAQWWLRRAVQLLADGCALSTERAWDECQCSGADKPCVTCGLASAVANAARAFDGEHLVEPYFLERALRAVDFLLERPARMLFPRRARHLLRVRAEIAARFPRFVLPPPQ